MQRKIMYKHTQRIIIYFFSTVSVNKQYQFKTRIDLTINSFKIYLQILHSAYLHHFNTLSRSYVFVLKNVEGFYRIPFVQPLRRDNAI